RLSRASSSKPALFLRQPDRFEARACMKFLDGERKMISHRSLGQVEGTSELPRSGPRSAHRQDLSFARRQWVLALLQRRDRKLRINDPLPNGSATNRINQYRRGRVLEDESNRALI